MESSKLKNIILIILLITNVLLLGLVIDQREAARRQDERAIQDAVDLLAQQGIAARAEDIPSGDLPAPMTVERGGEREQEVFAALLGEDVTLTQRGLVSLYSGSLGAAEVRGDGGFSVAFAPGAYPLAQGEGMEAHAQSLVQRLGFTTQLSGREGERVRVTQVYAASSPRDYFPIFSCAVTVEYRDGQAVSMEGTHLPGTPTPDRQAGEPLSTATLLVRFRAGIIDSGDACTAIHAATQGYILSGDPNGTLRLTPVLRLETDTNLYIVNALNGELSRG